MEANTPPRVAFGWGGVVADSRKWRPNKKSVRVNYGGIKEDDCWKIALLGLFVS